MQTSEIIPQAWEYFHSFPHLLGSRKADAVPLKLVNFDTRFSDTKTVHCKCSVSTVCHVLALTMQSEKYYSELSWMTQDLGYH